MSVVQFPTEAEAAEAMTTIGAPALPACSPDGSPFVAWTVTRDANRQMLRVSPPAPPSREIAEWDGDDEIVVGEMTDGQFAEATRQYEAGLAEWRRMGGCYVSEGRVTIELRALTSGMWEAVYVTEPGAKDWALVQWGPPRM